MTLSKVYRVFLVAAGPISSAAAQFLLSFQFLHVFTPELFGAFSFQMVVAQLMMGIWGALFCSPLPVLLAKNPEDSGSLFSANLGLALIVLVFFYPLSHGIGFSAVDSLLFSIYVGTMLLRSFGRAYAYSKGLVLRTLFSDLIYSLFVLLAAGSTFLTSNPSPTIAYLLLVCGTVAGILSFGRSYLCEQYIYISISNLRKYRAVWARFSKWSLLGVGTTEATANAHAYMVTAVLGPSAFAVVAASSLFIRPLSVLTNALVDYERPRLARMHGGNVALGASDLKGFYATLIASWAMTAAGAYFCLLVAPGLIFPARYEFNDLVTGASLWMLIGLVRVWRTPASVLLQSAGVFRELASASVLSSLFSVFSVGVVLWLAGPIWSLLGVLVGEIVFAAAVLVQLHRWSTKKMRNLEN